MNADIRAISLYRRPISPEDSTPETKIESDNQIKTDMSSDYSTTKIV